ncbi:MAG: hypothetical protein ACI8XO_004649 [Verrucomicrobiales bacterium]|jgi:hypothetical protein
MLCGSNCIALLMITTTVLNSSALVSSRVSEPLITCLEPVPLDMLRADCPPPTPPDRRPGTPGSEKQLPSN